MNITTDTVGLLRREFRDVHSVVSNIDRRTRQLLEPRASRPAGLIARLAACSVISRIERRPVDAVARQHFANDSDLANLITIKAASGPAMTGQANWAAELIADAVMDVAQNLLPTSALSQLRELGIAYAFVPGSGTVRVPIHTPTPSGAFVVEAGAIPVAALILGSVGLKPKKAAAICAFSRELAQGSPSNVETSLRVLLGQDVGLMIDSILLGSSAATTTQPAGLLNGLTTLAPTAGGGVNALLGDVKKLLAAVSPALKPVLLVNATQAATFGILAPNAAAAVITAPYLAPDTMIALDASAFASAIGIPEFSVNEDPVVHMDSAPLPIVGGTVQPPILASVAAPTTSLWQTASIGIRTLLDADWALRRAGAVAFITGTTW